MYSGRAKKMEAAIRAYVGFFCATVSIKLS